MPLKAKSWVIEPNRRNLPTHRNWLKVLDIEGELRTVLKVHPELLATARLVVLGWSPGFAPQCCSMTKKVELKAYLAGDRASDPGEAMFRRCYGFVYSKQHQNSSLNPITSSAFASSVDGTSSLKLYRKAKPKMFSLAASSSRNCDAPAECSRRRSDTLISDGAGITDLVYSRV